MIGFGSRSVEDKMHVRMKLKTMVISKLSRGTKHTRPESRYNSIIEVNKREQRMALEGQKIPP